MLAVVQQHNLLWILVEDSEQATDQGRAVTVVKPCHTLSHLGTPCCNLSHLVVTTCHDSSPLSLVTQFLARSRTNHVHLAVREHRTGNVFKASTQVMGAEQRKKKLEGAHRRYPVLELPCVMPCHTLSYLVMLCHATSLGGYYPPLIPDLSPSAQPGH